jgi:hypothetical protein
MTEESIPDFPQPNPYELVGLYIRSELEKAGTTLQMINIDFLKKTCTLTTDIDVPENIKSNICRYPACKGITIEFLTSG